MDPPGKLKILYVITKSNFGGAQRYVHDLARAAQEAGHDVVVAFGGQGTLDHKLRQSGIRTISMSSLDRDVSVWADLKSLFRLYALVREERPDILHLNSSKVGALGALVARLHNLAAIAPAAIGVRRRRVAAVFTGHGWAFNEDRAAIARFTIAFLQWLTILLSHCVIAVSEATRRQVLSFPFARKKLVVVNNGVADAPLRDPQDAWARIVEGTGWETRFRTKPPLVIGTLAELHNNKGLHYALDGIALLRQQTSVPFVFTILGDGEQRRALADRIHELGLDDIVLLAGYRPNGSELLRGMDVFLLSSITEAFPYAILEAGSAGLPIVATRVGGIPDVIDDMESGLLIEPRNPGAIARALHRLIENAQDRDRFATRIRTRIVGGYSISRMTARTLSIYRSVRDRVLGLPPSQDAVHPEQPSGMSVGPPT